MPSTNFPAMVRGRLTFSATHMTGRRSDRDLVC